MCQQSAQHFMSLNTANKFESAVMHEGIGKDISGGEAV
jgi:hypothetical protein